MRACSDASCGTEAKFAASSSTAASERPSGPGDVEEDIGAFLRLDHSGDGGGGRRRRRCSPVMSQIPITAGRSFAFSPSPSGVDACKPAMAHSHCGDEDHSHGGHGHGPHSHSPPPDSIPGDSLFNQIDRDRVRCLNARGHGMAQSIIKPWNKRLDTEDVCHLISGKS